MKRVLQTDYPGPACGLQLFQPHVRGPLHGHPVAEGDYRLCPDHALPVQEGVPDLQVFPPGVWHPQAYHPADHDAGDDQAVPQDAPSP